MQVYKTTNLINSKEYVGQDSKDRPSYLGSGTYLKKAVKKYGKKNFKKEIIAWCKTQEQLDFLEIFYIDFFDTSLPKGYNILI